MTCSRDRRGVALLVVLLLLVVLGMVAADVGGAARLEGNLVVTLRARTVARYAAESGVLVATARVGALLDSVRTPNERPVIFRRLADYVGPLKDVDIGGAGFSVAFSDLNARLDLNRADPRALHALFSQFTDQHRADVIVASLQSTPLGRMGELAAVPGVDEALAFAVAPYVTVWSDGAVNVNSAPERVLAALPGMGDANARSLVGQREAGAVFLPTAQAQPARGAQISFAAAPPGVLVATVPSCLLVISRGWQQGSPLTHEIQAVYTILGSQLELQAWQERDL
jgi:DNA uptake protein ComE-like DNA-binding protein